MVEHDKAVTYTTYLKVDELLSLQVPLSDGPEHDELLFITIHQVYELWFQQILHELAALQPALEAGDTHRSLALLSRARTIMKTCVAQIDVLETMTPLQFASFRARLSSASGFQSAQFRELEAVLGRRDHAGAGAKEGSGMKMAEHLVPGSPARLRVEAAMGRASVWHSALRYCHKRGHHMPQEALECDVSLPWEAREDVQEVLIALHRNDPESSMVCEALVDFDEGLGEWRYRHVKMVERTLGKKIGSGGSAGVGYLAATLFNPVFPDLWEMRSKL
ncbi:tryptophan 2,3-dioxygenase family protein [Pontimonas sp.]|jgi:tryptophan 2,3-dioxygenase|nr:tryptophan 2,3-dioxygenase family protein [Pontimonas sp.]MDA8909438.1 tryptophan 2,3-dioxygenase family protein [Pontimonas sp.]|tara:strand:+ start:5758 stop:6588 length:831 start_codon:yes stop_codon:yes gene_type:complete